MARGKLGKKSADRIARNGVAFRTAVHDKLMETANWIAAHRLSYSSSLHWRVKVKDEVRKAAYDAESMVLFAAKMQKPQRRLYRKDHEEISEQDRAMMMQVAEYIEGKAKAIKAAVRKSMQSKRGAISPRAAHIIMEAVARMCRTAEGLKEKCPGLCEQRAGSL